MSASPKAGRDAVLDAVTAVFRETGYDGASLTRLSKATGLKRASLYHRFPGGKLQMAEEAMGEATSFIEEAVVGPLYGDGTPRERLDRAAHVFAEFYGNGERACLVNLFGSQSDAPTVLREGAQRLLILLIGGISAALEDAGFSGDEARARALRGVVLLQGAVVVSRGFRDPAPFRATMACWTDDLLAR